MELSEIEFSNYLVAIDSLPLVPFLLSNITIIIPAISVIIPIPISTSPAITPVNKLILI
jgi:hypothetical protein